ncbi:MAG: hypothetical protein ABIQ31_03805 [Ferruginibacter sp.]
MLRQDTLKKRGGEITDPLRSATRDSILPFPEEYPANTRKLDSTGNKNLNAHELFNKFTADIIKGNVIFTR